MRWVSAVPIVVAGVVAAGLGGMPNQALAATTNVACGDVPGLIAALQSAANGDTVRLGKQCNYTIAAPISGIDGLPTISVRLRLDGRGSTIQRSSASRTPFFRILHVGATGDLRLLNVRLKNGALDNFPGQIGAGVLNSGGRLTMNKVTITRNKAFQGGGVFSYGGPLTMTNSVVSKNECTDHGGGMHLNGSVTITDSQVTNNSALIFAGGILHSGPTTLVRTLVSGNSAGVAGGVMTYSNGPLTLIDSNVKNNTATGFGGIFSYGSAIWMVGSTVSGNKSTQGSGGGIQTSGLLALFSSAVTNNSAFTDGGGIFATGTTLLSNSSVVGNTALFGGGLDVSGSTTVYRTTLSRNSALTASGGAILAGSGTLDVVESSFEANEANFGGAVKSYGNLHIDRSTFVGNMAALGGAVAVLSAPAPATIVNSTFWGNAASTGGAIITYADVRVLSSTFGANSASASGGAGGIEVVSFNGPIGSLAIRNSIVATNTGASPNIDGVVTSLGYNLIGVTTGSSGWVATDTTGAGAPGFANGPAANGGPTETVALLPSSPARDLVPIAFCLDAAGASLTLDQRLFARPSGSACDAGAFEY